MRTIKGRIARLEGHQGEVAEPLIISWQEDGSNTNNWACALVSGTTFVKSETETISAFANRLEEQTATMMDERAGRK